MKTSIFREHEKLVQRETIRASVRFMNKDIEVVSIRNIHVDEILRTTEKPIYYEKFRADGNMHGRRGSGYTSGLAMLALTSDCVIVCETQNDINALNRSIKKCSALLAKPETIGEMVRLTIDTKYCLCSMKLQLLKCKIMILMHKISFKKLNYFKSLYKQKCQQKQLH